MSSRALCVSLDAALGAGAAPRLSARLTAAALLADLAGADRVRVSVREELSPIGVAELRDLRRAARRLELRIAPVPGLVKCALEARPERVVLASEPKPGLPHAPLDVAAWGASLPGVVRALREAGILPVLSLAPTLDAVKAARAADAPALEFATSLLVDLPPRERDEALTALGDAARFAAKLRIEAGAGGGLDTTTLAPVLESAPSLGWITSGRAFVERALLIGIERAVRDWRERL
jgi:pyridoxine 5'-phosphate synthase PdxJ